MIKVLLLFSLFCPKLGMGQDLYTFEKQIHFDSLNVVTSKLIDQGKYYLALQMIKKVDSIILKTVDSISLSFAYYSLNKGRINAFYSKTKDAEENLLKARILFKSILGESHSVYLKCINYLAIYYKDIGSYKNSELYYSELKIQLAKTFGKRDSQYLVCLNEMGLLYKDIQKFGKAEEYLLEAKKIQLLNLSSDHPDVAYTLNNLAILYKNMGRYNDARINYSEALRIRELQLGKQHLLYTSILLNLANLYIDLGNYQLSEKAYLEVIQLREKEYGLNHPYYATSLEGLALLYKEMGIYTKAIELEVEVNKIRAGSLGVYSIVYAGGLSNLAQIYTLTGTYDEALKQYQFALKIYRSILGKEHLKYLECLNRMAILYTYRGNYSNARSYFEELLTTRSRLFGQQNTQYAEALSNLAFLYNEMGSCDSSKFKLLESLKIYEMILGPKHHKCAQVMDKLAELYKDLGKIQQADSLFRISKTIKEKMLGKNHKLYSLSLNHLAEVNEVQKKFSNSEKLLKELNELEQERLRNAITFLSEMELTNYAASFQQRTNELGTYILSRPLNNSDNLSKIILDNTIFSKGFLMNTAARINQLSSKDPNLSESINSLRGIRKQLAVAYAKPKVEQRNVSKLESKANSIEKKLRRLDLDFLQSTQQIRWQDLRERLKPNEAAIEFIQFQMPAKENQIITNYAAILLRSDLKSPQFINLCKETDLDSLIKSKYKQRQEYINAIYKLYNRGAKEVKLINKSLYELIWKPIEPELVGVTKIYYSPGGLIHRINLGAILSTKSLTLAEQFQLIELNSTRQLAIQNPFTSTNNHATLYGGIFYTIPDTAIATMPLNNQQANISFNDTIFSRSAGSWDFLDGTEQEVNSLNTILTAAGFNVELKTGYNATEESFKEMGALNGSSPRVINVATHGFFFPDKKAIFQNQAMLSDESTVDPEFVISEQPMMRSGLILAGGNDTWQGKKIQAGKEDGILTAYEISQLNFSNTELVVLSACETGLGDIQGNEGVYGLQRAFKIAGVKYLIMSLWQVPDEETSQFMISFYKNWLEQKLNIPDAFRAAQKAMKERFISPYQWAGFVLIE